MFQVPGFDSWDKYRLLSHGPTLPYQMFHLSPLWMPTARKTLLCPGWQGMSYYIQGIKFPHSHLIFVHLPFHEIFFVNFSTFYLWLLHKYVLKHKCIKIIRIILIIMSHLRSLFWLKGLYCLFKVPDLGISLLKMIFQCILNILIASAPAHWRRFVESIVNALVTQPMLQRRPNRTEFLYPNFM